MPPSPISVAAPKPTVPIEEPIPYLGADYISDNEADNATPPRPRARRSRRVIAQQHQYEGDKLNRIAFLAALNPYLAIKDNRPTRGVGGANIHLQLSERAYAQHIAGAVINDDTGEKLEYRDLINKEKCRDTWINSLAN